MRTFNPPLNPQSSKNIFCYEISLTNGKTLALTNYHEMIHKNGKTYFPSSKLNIAKAVFSDSGKCHMEINGTYENDGIMYDDPITDSRVKIYFCNLDTKYECSSSSVSCSSFLNSDIDIHELFTMFCTKVTRNISNFTIYLEPLTSMFDKVVVPVYSKLCRANLGDEKCSVKLEDYTTEYSIESIEADAVNISSCTKSDGYYNYGTAEILYHGMRFTSKIKYHYRDIIHLDRNVPICLVDADKILLTRGCDKTIDTCCSVYKNAINFRGEPFIPA